MRSWLLLLPLVACAAKDDRNLQGGGGHGGSGTGAAPDASVGNADSGGGLISGTVCVVTDLAAPFACVDGGEAHDVLVAEVGGASTRSDAIGSFALATDHTQPLLELGGENGDALVTTRFVADALASPVDAPAVDEGTWSDALLTLNTTQTTGAMLIYVQDANGPVAGATVSFAGTTPAGARIYYDDGAGGFDPNALATGSNGIAMVLDTSAASMRASDGTSTVTRSVPTVSGGIGIAVLTLL